MLRPVRRLRGRGEDEVYRSDDGEAPLWVVPEVGGGAAAEAVAWVKAPHGATEGAEVDGASMFDRDNLPLVAEGLAGGDYMMAKCRCREVQLVAACYLVWPHCCR